MSIVIDDSDCIGSSFDSFLEEEGILEECEKAAIKSLKEKTFYKREIVVEAFQYGVDEEPEWFKNLLKYCWKDKDNVLYLGTMNNFIVIYNKCFITSDFDIYTEEDFNKIFKKVV